MHTSNCQNIVFSKNWPCMTSVVTIRNNLVKSETYDAPYNGTALIEFDKETIQTSESSLETVLMAHFCSLISLSRYDLHVSPHISIP